LQRLLLQQANGRMRIHAKLRGLSTLSAGCKKRSPCQSRNSSTQCMLAFAPCRGTRARPDVRLMGSVTDTFGVRGDGSQRAAVSTRRSDPLSVGKAVHRVESFGVDPSGLGRWVWRRFRGRNSKARAAVSFYPFASSRHCYSFVTVSCCKTQP
jgi:hypothetical protein